LAKEASIKTKKYIKTETLNQNQKMVDESMKNQTKYINQKKENE
jgi:hypothetical protein